MKQNHFTIQDKGDHWKVTFDGLESVFYTKSHDGFQTKEELSNWIKFEKDLV